MILVSSPLVAYKHKMVLFLFSHWLQLNYILFLKDIFRIPHFLSVMVSDFKNLSQHNPIQDFDYLFIFHILPFPTLSTGLGFVCSPWSGEVIEPHRYFFSFLPLLDPLLFLCFGVWEEGRKGRGQASLVN